MKPVHYRGYIYWILMVLGVFVGNLFDKVDKETVFLLLFLVVFEICGDAVCQFVMWITLDHAQKFIEIKAKRNFLFIYMTMWTGFFPFPTLVEGLRRNIPIISMIEIPLLILLLLNQIRWVNYRVRKWAKAHNVELKQWKLKKIKIK